MFVVDVFNVGIRAILFSCGAIRCGMIAGFHRRRVRGRDGREILYCISSPFTRPHKPRNLFRKFKSNTLSAEFFSLGQKLGVILHDIFKRVHICAQLCIYFSSIPYVIDCASFSVQCMLCIGVIHILFSCQESSKVTFDKVILM